MINLRKLYFSIAIPFGVFIFVYGGWDDSPGAQLLGLVFVVVGIVGLVKCRKVARRGIVCGTPFCDEHNKEHDNKL